MLDKYDIEDAITYNYCVQREDRRSISKEAFGPAPLTSSSLGGENGISEKGHGEVQR